MRRQYGRHPIFHSLLPLRVKGPLDMGLLERVLSRIVERHDSLRTRFAMSDGDLVQRVATSQPIQLAALTLPAGCVAANALQDCIQAFVAEDFDLESDLMLRARVYTLGDDEHALLVIVHHIVYDGWSMGLLLAEIAKNYRELALDEAPEERGLPIQYADYADWCARNAESQSAKSSRDYWARLLAGAPTTPWLPTDRPRPETQTWAGACFSTRLPVAALSALETLAAAMSVSIFQVFLGVLAIELRRMSGRRDVLIGSPAANRVVPEVEQLIGLFVNLLPLRFDIDDSRTFAAMLKAIRETVLESLEHQGVPFEQIASLAGAAPSSGHHSLVQVVATYAESPGLVEFVPGSTYAEPISYRYEDGVHFDLTFILRRDVRGLTLDSYYATDLFDATTVEGLVARLLDLLDTAVRHDGSMAIEDMIKTTPRSGMPTPKNLRVDQHF